MSSKLPDVAEILGPVLARVEPEQRPLLMAIAERMAAERYRGWAEDVNDPAQRERLRACADREEEIAGSVEALYPEASAIQADLRAKNPDLVDLNRSIFEGRSVGDQYTIQAQGERVGALTWRTLAEKAGPEARRAFLSCAELEERSAEVLEAILGGER